MKVCIARNAEARTNAAIARVADALDILPDCSNIKHITYPRILVLPVSPL